jgi:hypothetical protein
VPGCTDLVLHGGHSKPPRARWCQNAREPREDGKDRMVPPPEVWGCLCVHPLAAMPISRPCTDGSAETYVQQRPTGLSMGPTYDPLLIPLEEEYWL